MFAIRSPRRALVAAWFAAFGITSPGFPLALVPQTQAPSKIEVSREFETMLAKVDAAQLELQNGSAAAFKALWSHSDDITLAGGFGGTIEKGWDAISRRLDWVAAQFSRGAHTHERIVETADGSLGYVVQMEHIRFHVPGQEKEAERNYRVTMVFRREAEGWRIVHRQADSQMTKQAPQ